jgi:hypothetical protein
LRRNAWVNQDWRIGGIDIVGVDIGLDALVEAGPMKNAGKNLFHDGVSFTPVKTNPRTKESKPSFRSLNLPGFAGFINVAVRLSNTA